MFEGMPSIRFADNASFDHAFRILKEKQYECAAVDSRLLFFSVDDREEVAHILMKAGISYQID
jgi:hypothetical protein